ncbi:MAG: hypothetical protein P4L84_08295 [Isosphaeraceae bacterium]|nr:hypothetical protein [Isosphaeraceae bacterium]
MELHLDSARLAAAASTPGRRIVRVDPFSYTTNSVAYHQVQPSPVLVREAQLSSAATDGQVESAWATALQDDHFRAAVEEGERDVRTGRLTSWQEVRERLVTRSS